MVGATIFLETNLQLLNVVDIIYIHRMTRRKQHQKETGANLKNNKDRLVGIGKEQGKCITWQNKYLSDTKFSDQNPCCELVSSMHLLLPYPMPNSFLNCLLGLRWSAPPLFIDLAYHWLVCLLFGRDICVVSKIHCWKRILVAQPFSLPLHIF